MKECCGNFRNAPHRYLTLGNAEFTEMGQVRGEHTFVSGKVFTW
jgi:hypothetical protein